jgi:hypothetical protein
LKSWILGGIVVGMPTTTLTQVTIRPANADDSAALTRLATIDSAPVPSGPLLLAEVDGELHAALALADGRVIADPFVRTSALVELLRERTPTRRGAARRRPRDAWRASRR